MSSPCVVKNLSKLSHKSNFTADILGSLKIKKEKQLFWKKPPLLFLFNLNESKNFGLTPNHRLIQSRNYRLYPWD